MTRTAGRRVLVGAAQAAELLDVPASWILAQARTDRIPHVRLGRYVRFDPDELEDWWRGRMRGSVVRPGPGPVPRHLQSP